jgi:3-oxoacyl-[acyl-carrier-protein] synthase III
MAPIRPVGIAGTGSYLPERVVSNAWFEKIIDTSDEWIRQRTGILERRFAAENEQTSTLSINASKLALEAAGLDPRDLDAIIVGTLTPDQQLPSCAVLVQEALQAKRAFAFDVSSACTGFLNAMQVGEALIASGRARRVLAVGAEILSRCLDMQDRSSCILFGDGAGAAVLMPHADCRQAEILKSTMGADGADYELIQIPGGGNRRRPHPEMFDQRQHYIQLQGKGVFRFAVQKMTELIEEMLEGHSRDDLSLIVPHQVNMRIIDSALERLQLPIEKVIVNIDRYANTSAATVPIALDEAVRTGRIEKGKLVILVAFGAGVTWGANLIRW